MIPVARSRRRTLSHHSSLRCTSNLSFQSKKVLRDSISICASALQENCLPHGVVEMSGDAGCTPTVTDRRVRGPAPLLRRIKVSLNSFVPLR